MRMSTAFSSEAFRLKTQERELESVIKINTKDHYHNNGLVGDVLLLKKTLLCGLFDHDGYTNNTDTKK